MALGLTLFRTISGDIQVALGYQQFFFFVLLCAIPVFLLSFRIIPRNETGSLEPHAPVADDTPPVAPAGEPAQA